MSSLSGSSAPSVVVDHVSVTYKTTFDRRPTLRGMVRSLGRGEKVVREVQAVKDVSFAIPHGTVLGIVGANGAGKSTLMMTTFGNPRALLMLFLFSEVGEDDAPTRIRVGSHLDVPPVLAPHGPKDAAGGAVAGRGERPGVAVGEGPVARLEALGPERGQAPVGLLRLPKTSSTPVSCRY